VSSLLRLSCARHGCEVVPIRRDRLAGSGKAPQICFKLTGHSPPWGVHCALKSWVTMTWLHEPSFFLCGLAGCALLAGWLNVSFLVCSARMHAIGCQEVEEFDWREVQDLEEIMANSGRQVLQPTEVLLKNITLPLMLNTLKVPEVPHSLLACNITTR
jgi:hypothetical protein